MSTFAGAVKGGVMYATGIVVSGSGGGDAIPVLQREGDDVTDYGTLQSPTTLVVVSGGGGAASGVSVAGGVEAASESCFKNEVIPKKKKNFVRYKKSNQRKNRKSGSRRGQRNTRRGRKLRLSKRAMVAKFAANNLSKQSRSRTEVSIDRTPFIIRLIEQQKIEPLKRSMEMLNKLQLRKLEEFKNEVIFQF